MLGNVVKDGLSCSIYNGTFVFLNIANKLNLSRYRRLPGIHFQSYQDYLAPLRGRLEKDRSVWNASDSEASTRDVDYLK